MKHDGEGRRDGAPQHPNALSALSASQPPAPTRFVIDRTRRLQFGRLRLEASLDCISS
ncbi:hypothetical protein [Burkholderia oklahomensis]|uniref:hypothetical protein n=1 Tax=Burkholderia oklahomensis TaxID=342113 RepID=UPI00131F0123|nr:hypothetical protein [Burkholderia oklahomensis]